MALDAEANRRDIFRVLGGGGLALLASALLSGTVVAQEATPGTGQTLKGA
jgi:hypothetical protein